MYAKGTTVAVANFREVLTERKYTDFSHTITAAAPRFHTHVITKRAKVLRGYLANISKRWF